MTTTIHFSGLYTDPPFLIHLASDSRCRVYPQVSLLPCRPDFRQMGLVPLDTHPLGNTNQFQPFSGNPVVPSLARHNDLLVIGSIEGNRRALMVAMDRALRGLGFARDIVVLTPEEFERDKQIPGTIARPAWTEGKVLYDCHQ